MRRIKVERLEPGDVVLTSNRGKTSKLVRLASAGEVSHAMLCVQNGSVVDSTHAGVQAHNIQRQHYGPDDIVEVFRLRASPGPARIGPVLEFARSAIGTRYSNLEAARSVAAARRPRGRRQFCSRLVARAYAHGGFRLVKDADYCTPEDLRRSPLLAPVEDMTEPVSEDEVAAWAARPNPIGATHVSQNAILAAARRLDPSVETFEDVDRLVRAHPRWDAEIARAYRDSGYLDLWKMDFAACPWHYDLGAMEAVVAPSDRADLRNYCIGTIGEFWTGGQRFPMMLVYYRQSWLHAPRDTTAQLVALYEQLVRNDRLRCETALAWLERHYPEDVAQNLERIEPHSAHWFATVDRVEPGLARMARLAIARRGSPRVCSICSDLPHDYVPRSEIEALPGVPSLRLCPACAKAFRAQGVQLEPH